ncbi:hypothetical protein ZIOFF_012166 [Zingiber officinale]|uniref:Bifunctional inhibitor/plant lipid transfer protein/seed storage helical domain-containing protein n=1 Tax=Zingiber officinale TaxID=94328 RepID=A0A8J5HP10_ZINOF|nr:hypothetical protein ZIOFF_012166 [Zingiber officinale]
MMCASSSWLLLLLLLLCVVVAAAADNSLQQQCTESTSSLTPCMDYGSGSSDRPNSDCCDTVRNIRGTNPVCLCYAVQQTHNCSSPWSTLGLKVERLLMLPALLNLSPTSPDYSIFTNTTQASNSSCDVSVPPSKALIHQINICVTFAIGLAVATFLS